MAVTGILYHAMFARAAKPLLAVEMLEHLFQFGCAFFGFTVNDGEGFQLSQKRFIASMR
jgi:hypothetical protein